MISDFVERLLFVREFEIGNGTTEVIGTRETLVPLKFLVRMQEAEPEKFYEFMNESVRQFFERVEKEMGGDTFKKAKEIFGIFGLGKMKIVDFNPMEKRALVEIHETPLLKDYSSHPVCSITTGMLSGMFTVLLKKDVHAVVNKCMAKGDHYCEFIMR